MSIQFIQERGYKYFTILNAFYDHTCISEQKFLPLLYIHIIIIVIIIIIIIIIHLELHIYY